MQIARQGFTVDNAELREWAYATFQARVLDMETAAVGHVAYANGVPFIAFRSLSDLAGGDPGQNQARAFYPGPIIILSARSALDDKLQGYDDGADIYLTKPVALPELFAALRSFARRRSATLSHMASDALTLNKLDLQGPLAAVKLTTQEAVVLTAMALPFTVLAPYLGFTPLPLAYFGLLAALVASYLLVVEGGKQWFYRHQTKA